MFSAVRFVILLRRQKRLGGAREVEQRGGGFVVRVPPLGFARLRPRGALRVQLVVRGVYDHRVAGSKPGREHRARFSFFFF